MNSRNIRACPLFDFQCTIPFPFVSFVWIWNMILYHYFGDVRVPVCPLCNKPVPVKKVEIPDVVVGEHIDWECSCHPRKKEKVRTNSVHSVNGDFFPSGGKVHYLTMVRNPNRLLTDETLVTSVLPRVVEGMDFYRSGNVKPKVQNYCQTIISNFLWLL